MKLTTCSPIRKTAGVTTSRAQAAGPRDAFSGGDRFGGFSDFFDAIFGSSGRRASFDFSARGSDFESGASITLDENQRGTKRAVRIPVEEPRPVWGGSGDQHVRLRIVVPPKATEKALELLKKLAADSDFDPRTSWN